MNPLRNGVRPDCGHDKVRGATAGAFTLVELLVVIGVVAVLAALIFPTFTSVSMRARDSKSISNLRVVGSHLFAYAADHNGWIPERTETIPLPGGGNTSGLAWHARLYADGYVDNRDVFFNPKEKYRTWNHWVADPTVPASLKVFTQGWIPVYGMRHRGSQSGGAVAAAGGGRPLGQENLNRLQSPSKFFLLVESWKTSSPQYAAFYVSSDAGWRIKLDERGFANAWFADGHVEAKDAAYFLGLKDTREEETGAGTYHVWPQP
ncbi:MAG TPA: type II secretion system protein [Terrimicrobiaceae bacterium]|nr:type II secretion system protein [Terrimicrobiaceae bacterium]